MRTLRLALLWLGIAVVVYLQTRAATVPFDRKLPGQNLRLLVHGKKKPRLPDYYKERRIDDALAEWNLTGAIDVALPPMYYRETPFGNAGFLSSFVNHGEVVLYNHPYPHPKLSIDEKQGDSGEPGYHFDNRATNAALAVRLRSEVWPIGYTAWYDLVWQHRILEVPTPYLTGAGGQRIAATAVRAVHPLNRAIMYGDVTRIDMGHWSPIVWTFPQEGRLRDAEVGFSPVDSVADGAEVSYLPAMPTSLEDPFGMFLLASRVAPVDASAPRWWPLDERFRRAVVDGAEIAERRALLRQLAEAYPLHPLLAHYRVIAELGGAQFDETWLQAQRLECQASSWYLVAWTQLPWRTVRALPCLAQLPSGTLDVRGEYVAESAVLAFRAERDDDAVKDLAARVIDRSYLRSEFRGFNYPISDFAWLWLRARR